MAIVPFLIGSAVGYIVGAKHVPFITLKAVNERDYPQLRRRVKHGVLALRGLGSDPYFNAPIYRVPGNSYTAAPTPVQSSFWNRLFRTSPIQRVRPVYNPYSALIQSGIQNGYIQVQNNQLYAVDANGNVSYTAFPSAMSAAQYVQQMMQGFNPAPVTPWSLYPYNPYITGSPGNPCFDAHGPNWSLVNGQCQPNYPMANPSQIGCQPGWSPSNYGMGPCTPDNPVSNSASAAQPGYYDDLTHLLPPEAVACRNQAGMNWVNGQCQPIDPRQLACLASGGGWQTSSNTCLSPGTIACQVRGGQWNGNTCLTQVTQPIPGMPVSQSYLLAMMSNCQAQGGRWDGNRCQLANPTAVQPVPTPLPPVSSSQGPPDMNSCQAAGGNWDGSVCQPPIHAVGPGQWVAIYQPIYVPPGQTPYPPTWSWQPTLSPAQSACQAQGNNYQWNGNSCVYNPHMTGGFIPFNPAATSAPMVAATQTTAQAQCVAQGNSFWWDSTSQQCRNKGLAVGRNNPGALLGRDAHRGQPVKRILR